MTSLCEAVRGVLLDRICHQGPIELSESNVRSRGEPVRLLSQTSFWAARLEDQHFLPILAEISADRSLPHDKLSAISVYEIPPGGEIHLESFF